MKLTRFRGHPNICVQGAHDGEDETTLHTGIPSPDGRAGPRRPLAGGTGAGVRTDRAVDQELGRPSGVRRRPWRQRADDGRTRGTQPAPAWAAPACGPGWKNGSAGAEQKEEWLRWGRTKE